ncbi:MAG: GIY-YIG nuclease family protein [Bacteroidales bacterium]|nr:GIY-YIG nuclease family protein [Bacteroidales bacterium]
MNTKKENKNAYKQMKFRTGIYYIKNIKNNKLFLKISTDLDRAFNSDQFQLKLGSHRNNDLQSDWNTFGSDNFEFGIFDELKSKETTTEIEIKKDLNDLLELHKVELHKKGIMLY